MSTATGAAVERECPNIVKVECLRCGYSTTDPTSIDLWNGYACCLNLDSDCDHDTPSRWTHTDGTVTVVTP